MQAARHFFDLVQQNRFTEARQLLAQADEGLGEEPMVRRGRALMAFREGDPGQAIAIYRGLLEAHGDPADAEALGGLLLRTQRFEDARAAYEDWRRRWPDRRGLLSGYVDSLEAVGDPETARVELRRIVELDPSAGRAWYRLTMLGDYEWIHQRREELLAADKKARDRSDRYAREFAAARYLETQGEWDEAFRRMQRANELRRSHGTLNIFNTVGFIRRIFPNAHIVHCRRDPLDTCIACFRTNFNALDLSYNLRELGWFYGYYEGMMDFWDRQFGESITEVKYERLVSEPRQQIAGLLDALDLPWFENCLRFHENPRVLRTASIYQIKRPVYTSAVGRAEHYRRHLRPLEKAIEESRGWMRPPANA